MKHKRNSTIQGESNFSLPLKRNRSRPSQKISVSFSKRAKFHERVFNAKHWKFNLWWKSPFPLTVKKKEGEGGEERRLIETWRRKKEKGKGLNWRNQMVSIKSTISENSKRWIQLNYEFHLTRNIGDLISRRIGFSLDSKKKKKGD